MNDQLQLFQPNETIKPGFLVAEVCGSFYIHRISGERLKLVKLYGSVAKCEIEHEIVITEKPYLSTKTVICDTNNLIIIL